MVNGDDNSKILRPIHDPQFDLEVELFLSAIAAGELLLEALEWTLCRTPQVGYQCRTRDVWYFPIVAEETYWVYYSFDSEIIYFLSIVPAHEGNGRDH
jgi:hypothetical protein